MKTKIIEAVSYSEDDQPMNHGKFLVGRLDVEYSRRDVEGFGLLQSRWSPTEHLLVMDLETGEGAMFRHGGLAKADLTKHRIWVCVLFQPFLEWLYKQDVTDLDALPDTVKLKGLPLQMSGYRRPGIDVDDVVGALYDARERMEMMGRSELAAFTAGLLFSAIDEQEVRRVESA